MTAATFRLKSRAQLPILLAILAVGLWILLQPRPAHAADASSHRTSAEILTELTTAEKNLPQYDLPAQIDPRARRQMATEMAPPIKHMVELITELESVDKARALPWRTVKCMAMARLAIWGDADAPKSLTESANSSIPADAVFGKAGLMMTRWWTIRPDLAVPQHQGRRQSQRTPPQTYPRQITHPKQIPRPTLKPF